MTSYKRTQSSHQDTGGFTMIEMMIALSVLMVLMMVAHTLFSSTVRAAAILESKSYQRDDARNAMQYISRRLALAESATILGVQAGGGLAPLDGNPVNGIRFRFARDMDGNGAGVDGAGNAEYGPFLTWRIATAADGVLVIPNGSRTLAEFDDLGNLTQILATTVSRPFDGPGVFYDAGGTGGIAFSQVGAATNISLIMRRRSSVNAVETVLRLDRLVNSIN